MRHFVFHAVNEAPMTITLADSAVEKIKALGGEALAEKKEEMAVEQNESQ